MAKDGRPMLDENDKLISFILEGLPDLLTEINPAVIFDIQQILLNCLGQEYTRKHHGD